MLPGVLVVDGVLLNDRAEVELALLSFGVANLFERSSRRADGVLWDNRGRGAGVCARSRSPSMNMKSERRSAVSSGSSAGRGAAGLDLVNLADRRGEPLDGSWSP